MYGLVTVRKGEFLFSPLNHLVSRSYYCQAKQIIILSSSSSPPGVTVYGLVFVMYREYPFCPPPPPPPPRQVSVYDENKSRPAEFLGRIRIPLLRVINGERRWFQLKDAPLTNRVKGCIELEMELIFNPGWGI